MILRSLLIVATPYVCGATRLIQDVIYTHNMISHIHSVLQCVAVCCSVLQCVAVCCSVLQCVAVCCSVLQSLTYTRLIVYMWYHVMCTQHDSSRCHLYMSHIHIRHVPLRVYSYEWVMSHTWYSCVISHNRYIWVTSPCGSIDWFRFPIFCTNWDVRDDHKLFTRDHQINDRAVPVKVEIHKGAILAHIAPLWISQPNNANQSLRMDGSCHIPNTQESYHAVDTHKSRPPPSLFVEMSHVTYQIHMRHVTQ